MSTLQESYPIAMEVLDETFEPAIYILPFSIDKEAHIRIHLQNVSGNTLFLKPLTIDDANPISESNCHFELRFRKGTLADTALSGGELIIREAPATWDIAIQPSVTVGKHEWDAIYLAKTDHVAAFPWLEEPAADGDPSPDILLQLGKVVAAAGGGSRSTLVQLVPKEVYREAALTNRVAAQAEQLLKVIDHIGSPKVPFHAEIVGSNQIINDGRPHSGTNLTLRISNIEGQPITFTSDSRFEFQFDAGDANDEWALATGAELQAIEFFRNFAVADGEALAVRLLPLSRAFAPTDNPSWQVGPHHHLPSLPNAGPTHYMDVLISLDAFLTHHPTGQTLLHIRYFNVQGYRDNELRVVLQKQPFRTSVETIDGHETIKMDTAHRQLAFFNANGVEASQVQLQVRHDGHVHAAKAMIIGTNPTDIRDNSLDGVGIAIHNSREVETNPGFSHHESDSISWIGNTGSKSLEINVEGQAGSGSQLVIKARNNHAELLERMRLSFLNAPYVSFPESSLHLTKAAVEGATPGPQVSGGLHIDVNGSGTGFLGLAVGPRLSDEEALLHLRTDGRIDGSRFRDLDIDSQNSHALNLNKHSGQNVTLANLLTVGAAGVTIGAETPLKIENFTIKSWHFKHDILGSFGQAPVPGSIEDRGRGYLRVNHTGFTVAAWKAVLISSSRAGMHMIESSDHWAIDLGFDPGRKHDGTDEPDLHATVLFIRAELSDRGESTLGGGVSWEE